MSPPLPPAPTNPEPLYLAGPTGSGKSSIALALAQAIGDAEIVNADAYQIYRNLDILTASPTAEALALVPHHLYSVLEPSESCDAAAYADRARSCIAEIGARGILPIVTGGTGLYLKALTHGLSDLPPADATLRAELDALPLEELVHRLEQLDPEGAAQTNLKNRRYVQRALEITLQSGHPASEMRTAHKEQITLPFRGVLLIRDREDLYARSDARAHEMVSVGLLQEVAALGSLSPTAKKAIGIAAVRDHLAGKTSREECIVSIQQSTRRYAKRQLTWFKRESGFLTVHLAPDDTPDSAVAQILNLFPELR